MLVSIVAAWLTYRTVRIMHMHVHCTNCKFKWICSSMISVSLFHIIDILSSLWRMHTWANINCVCVCVFYLPRFMSSFPLNSSKHPFACYFEFCEHSLLFDRWYIALIHIVVVIIKIIIIKEYSFFSTLNVGTNFEKT